MDYGSFHPTADVPQLLQHNSSHALLSPHSIHSTSPHEVEDRPNTSTGTKMTQGGWKSNQNTRVVVTSFQFVRVTKEVL